MIATPRRHMLSVSGRSWIPDEKLDPESPGARYSWRFLCRDPYVDAAGYSAKASGLLSWPKLCSANER